MKEMHIRVKLFFESEKKKSPFSLDHLKIMFSW